MNTINAKGIIIETKFEENAKMDNVQENVQENDRVEFLRRRCRRLNWRPSRFLERGLD